MTDINEYNCSANNTMSKPETYYYYCNKTATDANPERYEENNNYSKVDMSYSNALNALPSTIYANNSAVTQKETSQPSILHDNVNNNNFNINNNFNSTTTTTTNKKDNVNDLYNHKDMNNNKENLSIGLPASLHVALKHLYQEMLLTKEENELLRRNQQEQSAMLKRILERQASLETEFTQHVQKSECVHVSNEDLTQSVQVLTEHMSQLKQRHEHSIDKLRKMEVQLKRDKSNRELLHKETQAIIAQNAKDQEERKLINNEFVHENNKRLLSLEAQMQILQNTNYTEERVNDKIQRECEKSNARITQVEQMMVSSLNDKIVKCVRDYTQTSIKDEFERKCTNMSQSIEHIAQECQSLLNRSEKTTASFHERFASLTREQQKSENE